MEAVWNIIEKYKENQQKQNGKSVQAQKEEKSDENNKRKLNVESHEKSKKAKLNFEVNQDENEVDKFSFQGTILEILKSKGSISKSKLQKKVINAYLKWSGAEECSEKTLKKYEKKLKKIKNVIITNDTVSLTSEM